MPFRTRALLTRTPRASALYDEEIRGGPSARVLCRSEAQGSLPRGATHANHLRVAPQDASRVYFVLEHVGGGDLFSALETHQPT